MKRAEVWQDRSSRRPTWCVGICHWRDRVTGPPIHLRPDYFIQVRTYPTHAEALKAALIATGLAVEPGTNPPPMESP